MKTKLLQILYDMRHQPVISCVTFIGTAMAIFLIMVVVMLQQVQIIPYPPESCRNRLMVGTFMHTTNDNGNDASAGLNQRAARRLYSDIDGVERVSFMTLNTIPANVKGPTGESFTVDKRVADAEFFNIFDHPLVEGRYYTHEEADALADVAVVSQSVADRLFGANQRIGSKFYINYKPYNLIGIVRDNTPLAPTGSGQLFIPTSSADKSLDFDADWGGMVAAALLVEPGVDFDDIRREVRSRYAQFDTEFLTGAHSVYHGQPYDTHQIAAGLNGSNGEPDVTHSRNLRYALYAILLLIPAINLSSMLNSRMRRRISEFGVRRAFGCTRSRIITDILVENMIVTLMAGLFGVILSILFAASYSGLYATMENFNSGATPPIGVLFDWHILLPAFVFCLLLNIICASVPAWIASRLNPVDAINANK